MRKELKIPLDKDGNMLRYEDSWSVAGYTDNEEWFDTLEYKSFTRGRSAAYFIFYSNRSGRKFFVFMKDLNDMIPHMRFGKIEAKFTYCKRGQNYGIRVYK